MIVSEKFDMLSQDWGKVGKNALIFAGPALLVLIASFVDVLPKEGVWVPVVLYLLNVLMDILKKFLAESVYKPGDK